MLMRHFFSRFSVPAGVTVFLAVFLVFGPGGPAAMADEIEVGGYTLDAGETIEGPKVFISEDPEADRIVFEEGADIDAEVPYEPTQWAKDFEQWRQWHRETGADPDQDR